MPRGRAALLTLTAAALAAGCAHAPRPAVARATGDLRCEDAARTVAARSRTRPLDDLRRSATLPFSLAASGAGWVTDGALVVSAGVAVGGLVCAPILALEAAAKSDGSATARCFVWVGGTFIEGTPAPGIGRGLYRATRSWRCPDFVQLAREVTAVAACYGARDAPGDRDLALLHLEQLHADREIWGCLPEAERRAAEETRARLLAPAIPDAPPPAPGPSPASPPGPPPSP
jgi:hypothetical protein